MSYNPAHQDRHYSFLQGSRKSRYRSTEQIINHHSSNNKNPPTEEYPGLFQLKSHVDDEDANVRENARYKDYKKSKGEQAALSKNHKKPQ